MSKNSLKLKIDAHVIQQLGAELISGPEIALLELIKNSHDADADYCHIEIDTKYKETINNVEYLGRIVVKDDGHGMNRETIDKSWLTVSYSEKREAKEKNQTTKKHERTLTGDKGLGRLGSMQLGHICRISTHTKANVSGIQVSFCWDDFHHGISLDKVWFAPG